MASTRPGVSETNSSNQGKGEAVDWGGIMGGLLKRQFGRDGLEGSRTVIFIRIT